MNKKKTAPRRAPTAPTPAVDPGFDLKRIRDLARIASEYDLEEIEVGADGAIRVSRLSSVAQRGREPLPAAPPAPVALVSAFPTPVTEPAKLEDGTVITSPFVGTFYRSPSPEADPFVEIGQVIRKGQVVCIVEAMKLMNEIEAEADGKLVEILAKNGDHVEYGQALFRLAKI